MSDAGRYRIQAVAELTGVSAATLRQWERRYGLPSPDRTRSSYRLYAERDIEHIRRMQALLATGVSPSEAARAIKSADLEAADAKGAPEAANADAATPTGSTGGPAEKPAAPRAPNPVGDIDPYLAARSRLLEAIQRYDFDGLQDMCRKLMYMGSAIAIFERVIAPVMREVGQRWHDGKLSVAQEHMASEAISQLLHQMLPIVQPEGTDKTAVLACFGEDLHVLPLYGIAFRIAQWGFRTIVLGARTPPSAIAHAVANLSPTVVGLSITLPITDDEIARLARAYGDACGEVPWMVGGRAARRISPILHAAGAMMAPTDAEALRVMLDGIARKRPNPAGVRST